MAENEFAPIAPGEGYVPSPMSPGRTQKKLERAKGFEPSTPTLARSCSTPELHPHPVVIWPVP